MISLLKDIATKGIIIYIATYVAMCSNKSTFYIVVITRVQGEAEDEC